MGATRKELESVEDGCEESMARASRPPLCFPRGQSVLRLRGRRDHIYYDLDAVARGLSETVAESLISPKISD